MKFPIFASLIIFCIWLGYELHKRRNMDEKSNQSFWEKEAAANSTRRKSLDDLEYIQIPFENLPMDVLTQDPIVAECHETLHSLCESPIVNFTGISNTDLKLKYGAPNIDLLSRYDQSYTVLVRTLQTWAGVLYKNSYVQEACRILEFAVSTRTDVSATYRLLAEIYRSQGEPEKISALIPVAENLNSSLSGYIVNMLRELSD